MTVLQVSLVSQCHTQCHVFFAGAGFRGVILSVMFSLLLRVFEDTYWFFTLATEVCAGSSRVVWFYSSRFSSPDSHADIVRDTGTEA